MNREKQLSAKAAWGKLATHNRLRKELIFYLEGAIDHVTMLALDATIPEDELRSDIAEVMGDAKAKINKVWEVIEDGQKRDN